MHIIQKGRRKRNATERICFIQKKVTESDPGKIAGHSEQGSEDQVFRSSLIEQIEKEKDWQFTGEQTAELIRMAIYPDLRSEEERMQYEDFLMNGLDRVMSENEK